MQKKHYHLSRKLLVDIRTSNFHLFMPVTEEWSTQWQHFLPVPAPGCMNGCITGIMECLAQTNQHMHGWMRALQNLRRTEQWHFSKTAAVLPMKTIMGVIIHW